MLDAYHKESAELTSIVQTQISEVIGRVLVCRRSRVRRLLILILFLALPSSKLFSQSCSCEVSDNKEQEYNNLLNLDQDQQADSTAVHLPWGMPETSGTATNERVLYQEDYIIGYDDDLRVPLWTANRLTTADVTANRPRTECFRKDPRLPDDAAAFCEDYDEPIFDRGHMVPNADMKRSEAAMINTYMFSNMTPQQANLNQRIWSYFEKYVRALAKIRGEIFVITGAVFDKDGDGKRDPDNNADRVQPRDRVAIPTHYYKIILFQRSNGFIETMTVLLPHTNKKITGSVKSDKYLKDHFTTIDDIEVLTEIDFTSQLADNKEEAVENFQAQKLWPSFE